MIDKAESYEAAVANRVANGIVAAEPISSADETAIIATNDHTDAALVPP
jgi:hypothetical protein